MDPSVTVSRVYLYFYLMGNVGALTGSLSMAYVEKYVGFWLSYLLSTLVLCKCPEFSIRTSYSLSLYRRMPHHHDDLQRELSLNNPDGIISWQSCAIMEDGSHESVVMEPVSIVC